MKYFFSEKEIDFTKEHIDYEQFLLQEFFSADLETKHKVFEYYNDLYGSRSIFYLKRKYEDWANGDYHLTDLMKNRILLFMPKFLSTDARRKLEIHDFIGSIKNNIKSFENYQKTHVSNRKIYHIKSLISIFEKEYNRIQMLNVRSFNFNIITEEEKKEALEVSKYILEVKLQKKILKLEKDLISFLPYISRFKQNNFRTSYFIPEFNIDINLNNIEIESLKDILFTNKNLREISKFKDYLDKYLAYELVSIKKEENNATSNIVLSEIDLQTFFDSCDVLYGGTSEANIKSTFKGEAGILSISVEIKPLNVIKKILITSFIKAITYLFLTIILILFVINYMPFIFVGFIAIMVTLGLMIEELSKIMSSIKQYRTYGK